MVFKDEVRVYAHGASPNLALQPSETERVYTPDHKFTTPSGYIAVENGMIKLSIKMDTAEKVTIHHTLQRGWAASGAHNENWQTLLGSGTFYAGWSGGPTHRKFIGIVRMSPQEVVLRRREWRDSTGDFIEYDMIVRAGSPVVEIRHVKSRGSNIHFILTMASSTAVLQRLTKLWYPWLVTSGRENGTATDANGESMIAVYKTSVAMIGQQDSTTALDCDATAGAIRMYPGTGSLFVGGMEWEASPLASSTDQPLYREFEHLSAEQTRTGTWSSTVDANYSGGEYLSIAAPANGNYVQIPLHNPIPGCYVVGLRTFANGSYSDAWKVTVQTAGTTILDTPNVNTNGAKWHSSRPFLLGAADTLRFEVKDTASHLADAFVLFPLWRSKDTPSYREFPLNYLYQAMNRVNAKRDLVHLEQV